MGGGASVRNTLLLHFQVQFHLPLATSLMDTMSSSRNQGKAKGVAVQMLSLLVVLQQRHLEVQRQTFTQRMGAVLQTQT